MANEINDTSRALRRELKILGRITLDPPASGGVDRESYLCNIINMSLTGALVECGHSVPIGSLISYSFRMPGGEATIKVLAEVVRSARGSAIGLLDESDSGQEAGVYAQKPTAREGLNLYGIRFLDLKDDIRSAIKGYIKA